MFIGHQEQVFCQEESSAPILVMTSTPGEFEVS
jgi:hypothetical protein